MRSIGRWLLKKLVVLTIWKHQAEVIAVIGLGANSVVRELIFTAINSTFPARRNVETPEAEFSVPLTVLGVSNYPKNFLEWAWVFVRTVFLLIRFRSHMHFHVLELDAVNEDIQNYWLNVLDPEIVVITDEKSKAPRNISDYDLVRIPLCKEKAALECYSDYVVEVAEMVGVEPEVTKAILSITDLPSPRIRFLPGTNGSMVLDATHYYFPISIKSVLEVAKLSGDHSVVFTKDVDELKFLSENKQEGLVVNPDHYIPNDTDVIVLRGPRTHELHKYRYLLESQTLPLNEPLQSFSA